MSRFWRRAGAVAIATVFASFACIFSEWLFFATKLSFLSFLSLQASLGALLGISLDLSAAGLAAVTVLTIPSALLALGWNRWIRSGANPVWLCWCVPAGVLAVLSLLLVDNFTNTVLRFGVAGTEGIWRALYLVAGLAVFARIWYRLQRIDPAQGWLRGGGFAAAGLMVLASLSFSLAEPGEGAGMSAPAVDGTIRRPNIIWIGSDGVGAELLSTYGNEHETSPFLTELASEDSVLFLENAFVNAANTGGSLLSMLSSKSTATLRAILAPDVLRGRHAREHMPAVLKGLGYRNIALTIRFFADPLDFNLQDGFDVSDHRIGRREHFRADLGPAAKLLADRIFDRVSERILHIFFIRPMSEYYAVVAQGDRPRFVSQDEKRKLAALREFIAASNELFFAFIHGMRTHGPRYQVDRQVLSRGMSQTQGWMQPFMLDAVRDFDGFLRAVVGVVIEAGRFDDTLVVFSSDHGLDWSTIERVPLIIRLPPGAKGGRSRKNVELLDVAPTILDYIGAPIPAWMEGRSLLDMEAYEEHPIVAFDASGRRGTDYDAVSSFFGSVSVVVCGRWYGRKIRSHDGHVPWSGSGSTLRGDPTNPTIRTGAIPGYSGNCDDQLAPEEFERIVRDHFRARGYEIR